MTTQQTVKIQLVRSPIGTKDRTAPPSVVCLRKLNSISANCKDTPEARGMITKISYLVKNRLRDRDHGTQ